MTFPERRFAPRHRVDTEAVLALEGALLTRCQVVDLSPAGAMLRLLGGTALPRAIGDLLVTEYKMISRCRVVWSHNRSVGVTFIVPAVRGGAPFGRRSIMPPLPPWQSRWLEGLPPHEAK